MVTWSLCMIVRDEEAVLSRCLDSVAGVFDEIVIVDTGSRDRTREVAARYTDRVFDFDWIDDFAAARNASFAQARMEYCMWLDADDILLPEDREALLRLKEDLPADTDVVMLRYRTGLDSAGQAACSYYRERLIRNLHQPLWQGFVHEVIAPFGQILYQDIAVTHQKAGPGDPGRNLQIYEKKRRQGVAFDARADFYYARELYDHRQYDRAAEQLEHTLSRPDLWQENAIDACRLLADCRRALGQREEILPALCRSFRYDRPRAEICCEIGRCLMEQESYAPAAYWYEQALSTPRDDQSGGFVLPDCYGYLPAIQLCVCYDRMGNRAAARWYNDLAGSFRPESEAYRWNLAYFAAKEES